jgi:hypothetical protein
LRVSWIDAQSASVRASGSEEYGGRSSGVLTPVAPARISWLWRSSSDRRQPGTLDRLAWVKVCRAISWPSATIRRASSGWSATAVPTTKKVAFTFCALSRSSTLGVQTGSGPSSKVSAMVRALGDTDRGCPGTASITGPPVAIDRGTARVGPVGLTAPSASAPNM